MEGDILRTKNKGVTKVGKIVNNLQTMRGHAGTNQIVLKDLQRKTKNVIGEH